MEPIRDCKDKLEGAAREILSAMSALNMEPELLESPTGIYLSSTDRWAAHALEHLNAAFELLQEYRGKPVWNAGATHAESLPDVSIKGDRP